MSRRIAIVEDEAELAGLIEYNLSRSGFESRIFNGGDGTLAALERFAPDLIVLDVMLPDHDGFDLCRRIRAGGRLSRVPILFLTARTDEVDRVLGLEIGGDDYITKPFSPRELVARIKAHLRRLDGETEPTSSEVQLGPFRVDQAARRVYQAGRELDLTSTEYKLLEFFILHPGHAFSREQLLQHVWGEQHFVTPRTVDVHVRRLREQIEEKPDEPTFLATVRGFGYRFEAA
ncbi:MAG TPA: response regulator transcription factor [Bryobacteraceae bacterium]|nr:response regulator transcription factor [Bryobacteraceae bacterium]